MKSEKTAVIGIPLQRLGHGADLPLPAYATEHSAGLDLLAATEGEVVIPSGERALISTGIAIALPEGFEAQVRPRSGLALKHGVTVLNSPGTIDADYRGEIGVILINHGKEPFTVTRGMRIAQMVIAPYTRAGWQVRASLESSARGAGGFGSTGLKESGVGSRESSEESSMGQGGRPGGRPSPEPSSIAERRSAEQGQLNKEAC